MSKIMITGEINKWKLPNSVCVKFFNHRTVSEKLDVPVIYTNPVYKILQSNKHILYAAILKIYRGIKVSFK